ncbi:ABC transporter ATP-binding protein [Nocardioides sediminis]|uniref:ABC transporter ATP-binding protein n=1 Tax=Nocardioides sediminis TaxID=433648 RepID=UPI00131F0A4C|nr:ABC transporter ATP-binding protein [Nocardioides sediminis]
MGAAPALVSMHGVRFAYEATTPIIDGLTADVPVGSIVGVVGPSGCGKSTLLSLISGLEEPGEGTLTWEPDRGSPPRHPLTMMFQKDTLLPWLTVQDNIGLHFRYRRGSRADRAERKERVQHLIELAGLQGWERKYPYQLSGGMRRRAAFLTAVAPNPRMLLLDEPFSALDEPTRIGIHQDIFRIVKESGVTVVLITHDLGEAISLSDKVLVLSARPTTIVAEYDIPFGRERNMMELREHSDFLELYGTTWERLSEQIRRGAGGRSVR